MNAQIVFARIMGFLVIIITLALGPTIYTANAAIVSANLTNLIGMSAIAGFGAFIIIFGLLTSGGVLQVAAMRGGATALGRWDLIKVIGSVIVIIVMLTMFANVITYVNSLITSAIAASDTLGQVGFGIIPIIIYVAIIGAAGWAQVSAIKKMVGKRKTAGKPYI